jgi:hypothetical protein
MLVNSSTSCWVPPRVRPRLHDECPGLPAARCAVRGRRLRTLRRRALPGDRPCPATGRSPAPMRSRRDRRSAPATAAPHHCRVPAHQSLHHDTSRHRHAHMKPRAHETTTGATADPRLGRPARGMAVRPAATSSGLAGSTKRRPIGVGPPDVRMGPDRHEGLPGCAWCPSCSDAGPPAPPGPENARMRRTETRAPYGMRLLGDAAERASPRCAGPGQPIDRCHGRVRSRRRARHVPKLDFPDLGGYPQGHTHSSRAYKPERNR